MLVLVLLVLVLVLPLVLLFVVLLAAVCADYFARFFCRGLMKLFVHDVRGTLVKKRPALDCGAAERAKFGFVARGAFASTSDCLRRCEFRKQPLLLILKEIGASASGFGAGFSFVDARLPDARRTKIKAAAGAGAGAGAGWAQQRPTLSLKENAAAKTSAATKAAASARSVRAPRRSLLSVVASAAARASCRIKESLGSSERGTTSSMRPPQPA